MSKKVISLKQYYMWVINCCYQLRKQKNLKHNKDKKNSLTLIFHKNALWCSISDLNHNLLQISNV